MRGDPGEEVAGMLAVAGCEEVPRRACLAGARVLADLLFLFENAFFAANMFFFESLPSVRCLFSKINSRHTGRLLRNLPTFCLKVLSKLATAALQLTG